MRHHFLFSHTPMSVSRWPYHQFFLGRHSGKIAEMSISLEGCAQHKTSQLEQKYYMSQSAENNLSASIHHSRFYFHDSPIPCRTLSAKLSPSKKKKQRKEKGKNEKISQQTSIKPRAPTHLPFTGTQNTQSDCKKEALLYSAQKHQKIYLCLLA